eukprot:1157025-Pelagomonas_calceolata.AAC.5
MKKGLYLLLEHTVTGLHFDGRHRSFVCTIAPAKYSMESQEKIEAAARRALETEMWLRSGPRIALDAKSKTALDAERGIE